MSRDNTEQQAFWTDLAGPIWVAQMDAMDVMLAPVLDGLLQRAALQKGERVLDIGCGAGTSTIAAARVVGEQGHVCGVDISSTLLDVANARSCDQPSLAYLKQDAQTHVFPPQSIDCLISRFGMMFFEDSEAAFANLRNALRPGGRMVFATWGEIPENPFFTLPARVAKRVLGPVPKIDPDGPGPFAFRDPARVADILKAAGLADISIKDVPLSLGPLADADVVAELMCQIGPAERALMHYGANTDARAELFDALVKSLAPYQTAQGIQIPALINFCMARKPA